MAEEDDEEAEPPAAAAGRPRRRPRGGHRAGGRRPARRGRRRDAEYAEGEERRRAAEEAEEEPLAAPIDEAAIDLAAGARYRATGKRKSAIARVIAAPGSGTYTINGRTLDEYFPRATLQRNIRQPLETVGYEERMDVIARLHGGGVSAQAGALRHGISRALLEADPNLRGELKRRGFLTRDAARQGAQEGRPEEGAQAAAVLQALATPPARGGAMGRRLFGTDGVRGVAGELRHGAARARARACRRPAQRARAAAGARDPRHARVGRDARGRARGGPRVRRR